MSDRDSVTATERLEFVRLKETIKTHALRHSTSVDEAAADIMFRATIVAYSRSVPPMTILKGNVKLLQAYKELILERVTALLNNPEEVEQVTGAKEREKEEKEEKEEKP